MPPGKRTHAVAAADWDPSNAEDRGAPTRHAPEQPVVIVRRSELSSVNGKGDAKAQEAALMATLTIDCTHDNATVQGQLQEAKDILATCNGDPVALVFVYGDDKDNQEALARAAEDLGRVPNKVVALSVKRATSTLATPPRLDTDILTRLRAAFPLTRSLAITGCGGELPPPENSSDLTNLYINDASESARHSVAPYLPHLTSLHLLGVPDAHRVFMVRPEYDTFKLTTLVIAAPLDEELLARLVHHAWAIKFLTVDNMEIKTEDLSRLQWAVEELCVTAPKKQTRLDIDQLMRLPKRAKHGRTTIQLPKRTLQLPAISEDLLLVGPCCI